MAETTFETRRDELETYFDKTAPEKWVALTSNSPVSRIRETVRAGREEMRNTLLSWLPENLTGARVLDAGCGTGMLSIELARRGAEVVAIDISPVLIAEAERRKPANLGHGSIHYMAGDMSSPKLDHFDFAVAMDSFIHYPLPSIIELLQGLAPRTSQRILFTFAPRTPMLAAMKTVGKFFPKNDRSPAIEPVAQAKLLDAIASQAATLNGFQAARCEGVSTAFYKSSALELVRQ
ncbi:MAG: magnesium protoporphyrin IX methyltransferase [Pseudomonadota bacterium]